MSKAMAAQRSTLQVPGANLYYETRGTGPTLVMMPGGPADASSFDTIADQLAPHYTVVTYDPRDLSRSTVEQPTPVDRIVQAYADDVHHLLGTTAERPAYLFASSGGATIALDLVARYPGQIRRLVAHEPPSPYLLPDPDRERANMLTVADAFHAKGMRAAMDTFVVVARMQGEPPPPQPENPTPEWMEAMGRMQRNMNFFFGPYITAIANFKPDVAAIQQSSDRIVPGLGEESTGQVAHDGALGLASLLGTRPAVFPGAHGGFESHPQEFVTRLRRVFES